LKVSAVTITPAIAHKIMGDGVQTPHGVGS
jgi:hypothetical protein